MAFCEVSKNELVLQLVFSSFRIYKAHTRSKFVAITVENINPITKIPTLIKLAIYRLISLINVGHPYNSRKFGAEWGGV